MTGGATTRAERRIRWLLVGFTVILPLAAWPGGERPFSTIKLQLLAITVPAALLAAAGLRLLGRPQLPLAMDVGLMLSMASLALSSITGVWVSLPSLALAVLGLGWFWALMSFQPDAARLLRAVALSGGFIAAVALLQFVGLDPFRALGWTSQEFETPRMRLFSTLGNPNFVAAFLAGALPAQLSIAVTRWTGRRSEAAAAAIGCGLTMVALALTGSRGAYLGLGVALAWTAGGYLRSEWRRAEVARPFARVAIGLAIVLLLGVAVTGSLARNPRSLVRSIAGRLYIWGIAVNHLPEYVVVGLGPGSFGQAFQSWETADWEAGRLKRTNRPFAGPQDHAHNEYLELLVEQGIAGPASFLIFFTAFLGFAGRLPATSVRLDASAAGAVALAGVAIVDFPFHRPAELFLFWTLVAAGFLADQSRVEVQ